jgi:hypothetical protein
MFHALMTSCGLCHLYTNLESISKVEVHIAQRDSIIPDGRVIIRMMAGKTDQHVLTWALNHDEGLVKCKTF